MEQHSIPTVASFQRENDENVKLKIFLFTRSPYAYMYPRKKPEPSWKTSDGNKPSFNFRTGKSPI